jgi:predicted RNA-binding protein with PIN domain
MHLVVDGMNVIGSRPDGWWRDRDGAVRRLAGRLGAGAGHLGADSVTVVFDGRPVPGLEEGSHGPIAVLYARRPGRDAADDRIVELAGGLGAGALVVTSDAGLRRRVGGHGAQVKGVAWLLSRLPPATAGHTG